ncbi:glycosyltransferase family 2 protein [Enterococcus timonensis]|uniref:glycosyltransferase family 2 protein n=1 Tax=Enterococcus timonensis TaxID=1852364 RepID=UPI0008D91FF6|nr:glycosyltransferase family 2 protein [Enterococcus timonensis]
MKLSIVLVVYKKNAKDLPIYPLLNELADLGISTLIYDNSPFTQEESFNQLPVSYHHDPRNLGVAVAYNFALEKLLATNEDRLGLLLLDHDTQISLSYVKELLAADFGPEVGAIVPQIFAGQKQISPLKADRYIAQGFTGLPAGEYSEPFTGINSGACLNVDFLKVIGGFNNDFPLDFLDHWLFFEMGKRGYTLRVLPEIIQHDLSVLDYTKVSHQRFESILQGEQLFYQRYNTQFSNNHKKQLLKRTVKLFVKEKDRYFWKRTWQAYRQFK